MICGVEVREMGFEDADLAALDAQAREELRDGFGLFFEEPSWVRGGEVVASQEGVEAAARDANAPSKDITTG